jgi:anti-sigma factor RsiW
MRTISGTGHFWENKYWIIIGQNGLPMTLFTPEDLLLYLYKETSPAQTAAIEAALTEDWTLQSKLEELKASVDRLDNCLESPRSEAVQRILNYAKEADTVTTP